MSYYISVIKENNKMKDIEWIVEWLKNEGIISTDEEVNEVIKEYEIKMEVYE